MSNWYPKGKEALGKAQINFDVDTIKCAAVAVEDYVYSAAHQYRSSVTEYATTTDFTLTGVTFVDGVLDAADGSAAFPTLSADGTKELAALVFYKDTGDPATSPLLIYYDDFTPLLPNDGNISINWDNGVNKISRL